MKILATLGPASRDPDVLARLFAAGVDAVRLNFSHGTADEHRATAERVREVARATGRVVAILGDLSGPKIRTGTFARGPVQLVPGATFTLTTDTVPGDAHAVSMTYPLADDVRAGDVLLLDDGLLRLRVTDVRAPAVVTVVEIGGELSDHKGINVPGRTLRTPSLTPKDERDLATALAIGVDFLALSFVRTADDVRACKALAGSVPVIAKLEKPEAVANLEAIVDAADGVMVARGDLGVEVGSEKVPMFQKRAIRAANARGKLVVTATQMLDSMIRNPRPTRAEAADVANAVLDGTDALMLSGETAAGRYPVEAVAVMDAIAREVEQSDVYGALAAPVAFGEPWDFANACARAAAATSRSARLVAVVVTTRTGSTADVLAEYRPTAPVIAIGPDVRVAQRLALQWGTVPRVGDLHASGDVVRGAIACARECVGARAGDAIAIVVGGGGDVHASLTLARVT